MDPILIRRVEPADLTEWLRLRRLLFPENSPADLLAEMEQILAEADEAPVFVAVRPNGNLGGFLEGGTRKYADGCDTGPVAYIEAWFVDADLRRQGHGRALVQAMEGWAREHQFREIGSDTWLENETSIQAHQKLGYTEMERLVHFAKKL